MVKPPKTMQPEQVDVSRAGRKTGSAFQQDSFHNYMARKIDLQRQQFGQPSLPPPPKSLPKTSPSIYLPSSPSAEQSMPQKLTNVQERRKELSPSSTPNISNTLPLSKPSTPRESANPQEVSKAPTSAIKRKSPAKASEKRSVRFAQEGGPERKSKKRKKTPMTSIIRKLNRRHGRLLKRQKRISRREKRRRMALEEECEVQEENIVATEEDSPSTGEGSQAYTPREHTIALDQQIEKMPEKGEEIQSSSMKVEKASLEPDAEDKIQEDTPPLEDDIPAVDDDESVEVPNAEAPASPFDIRKSRPDLFFIGVTIKVNGYTEPDNETLKRMIQRHGGQFECYETQRVTHIVAEHLSTAKANIFNKQRNPVPVVSPRWITDSIEQQCQLPHGNYLIEEVRDDGQQKGIKDIFGTAVNKATRNKLPSLDVRPNSEIDKSDERITSEMETDIEKKSEITEKEEKAVETVPKEPPSSPQKTNTLCINGRIRTTGTDPDFLENYFNNSRLSFIGSYRQRSESAGANAPNTLNKDLANLPSYVFHVDMDCFFAAVAIRNFPQLKDKPVVISHHGKKRNNGGDGISFEAKVSKNSTSECATCNYRAREFGIKKGMFLGRAKELCPELVILNYDFEGYQEVSAQVSEILHQIASENHGSVQEVSCDESYMEMLQESHEQAAATAERIRAQIVEATQCTASIGVGKNKFLAKLGTDRIKPNASYVVKDHRSLLENLNLRDLPGIGWKSAPKLVTEGLTTVRQVWDLGSNAVNILERILGGANGKKIYNYCHGIDDRKVEPAKRKTIGAECNYGVRFDGPYGVDHFFKCLSNEVQKRMENVGVKGRHITLKVKQRKEGAKLPPKFLGHGKCHSLSRSMEIPGSRATCDAGEIYKAAVGLFKELAIPLDDVRGMGVVVSKLTDGENITNSSLTKWLEVANKSNGNSEGGAKETHINECEEEKTADSSPADDAEMTDSYQHNGAEQDAIQDDGEQQDSISAFHSQDVFDPRGDTTSTQIMLPPLSQLRMSQVDELPIEMQHQIKARLEKNVEDEVSEVIPVMVSGSPKKDALTRRANVPSSRHGESDNRLRQTDVQDMLKLAAVGTGVATMDISLDVLNELPMDIRLQVINGGAYMGVSSYVAGKNQAASINHEAQNSPNTSLVEETTKNSTNKGDHEGLKLAGEDLRAKEEPPSPIKQRPANLFEEDLLPLKLFLDENYSTDVEAIQLVVQFLTICVQEGRPKDALTMLRSICNRQDEWGTYSVIREIFEALDDEYFRQYRARLDYISVIGEDNRKHPP
ncbi:unnamed protein product [Cylindrotheca closterium]|uniref:DNA repair protein REV1 n=1 Tax=Cylindrotheca closterium TaxID=2856 RepID=A0AAD2FT42_9STRA|nr:unnamed protein product [Cylindrotheca closterium]